MVKYFDTGRKDKNGEPIIVCIDEEAIWNKLKDDSFSMELYTPIHAFVDEIKFFQLLSRILTKKDKIW